MSKKTNRGLIAFYLPHLGHGGVERSSFLLAEAFVDQGYSVEIVSTADSGHIRHMLPPGVSLHLLRTRRVIPSVPFLAMYLRRAKPIALISAQSYANIAAVWGKLLSRWSGKLIVTERLAVKTAIEVSGNWKDRLTPWLMRRFYKKADAIVANSKGAADSLSELISSGDGRVTVIYNPTNHPGLKALADEDIDDPWFEQGAPPVIVTVSRLERQKDLSTLLRAFSLATARGDERLCVIGDGSQLRMLEELAAELGVSNRVRFAGHIPNPYPFIKRAKLFVLSSLYEGLPNVVIESLVLGTPVVATDSPGGTAEVLGDGKYGILVQPGDADSLAAGMTLALTDYGRSEQLTVEASSSLERFTPDQAVSNYMKLLESEH